MFPVTRMRRLRKNEILRNLVRETQLSVNNLIYPLFVCEGNNIKNEIKSMPGCYQMSIDQIILECKEIVKLGIPGVILFGIPSYKDDTGSESLQPNSIISRAIKTIKSEVSNLLVISDVCLCEYTSHGHCGIIKNGDVENDTTIEILAQQALLHAQAGVDMIAPSDMMDGRIGTIRSKLDEFGFIDTPIMSYAAKYSSSFYGPFRDAANSAPKFGDRKTYQMDYANSDQALREVELDIQEGADIVMIKPALSYLDIIYRIKNSFHVPVAAYNVSGEYSAIMAAHQNGWIDKDKAMIEILTSIKRAGADIILTYFAKDAAKLI